MVDPLEYIKKSSDLSFLEELLNKWLPMDYNRLTEEQLGIESKILKIPVKELIVNKRKNLDKIKSIIESRIEFLKKQKQ